MVFKHVVGMFVAISFSAACFAYPQGEQCNKVWNQLTRSYLTEAKHTTEIIAHYLAGGGEKMVNANSLPPLDLTTFKVVESSTMTPGTFGQLRMITLKNSEGFTLEVFTSGEFECDGEEIVGIRSLIKE